MASVNCTSTKVQHIPHPECQGCYYLFALLFQVTLGTSISNGYTLYQKDIKKKKKKGTTPTKQLTLWVI